ADVREIEEQPLLHLVKLAAFDLVIAGVLVEAERKQLVLAAKIERQELVDKRQVVVDAADFKNLLSPNAELLVPIVLGSIVVALVIFIAKRATVPAVLNVAIELHAKLVRVQPRARAGQRAGAVIGVATQVGIGHA